MAQARRQDGTGLEETAHFVLRPAVGAPRDKLSHALLIPVPSRKHVRCIAVLRRGERPRRRSVSAERRLKRPRAWAEEKEAVCCD